MVGRFRPTTLEYKVEWFNGRAKMIVTLHGMPDQDGKDVEYDTGVLYFQDVLTVRISESTVPKLIPYTSKDTIVKDIKPVERDIILKFTHRSDLDRQFHYTVA